MTWFSKRTKKVLWSLAIGCILFLYFSPLLMHLIPHGMSSKEMQDFFYKKKVAYLDTVLFADNQKIHCIFTGKDTAPLLILIHGSPGSWMDMKDFLVDSALLQEFRIVAFDRPGYGESGGPGYSDLLSQAKVVQRLHQTVVSNQKTWVLAHSYGGPVALKFATLESATLGGMLLISPTVAPDVEEGITFKRLAQRYSKLWLVRWMMPEMALHSTQEMQPLPEEVRAMEKDLAEIHCPITELHGTSDKLAPYENQAYVVSACKNSKVRTVTIPDGDHFLVWSKHKLMVNLLEQMSNYP